MRAAASSMASGMPSSRRQILDGDRSSVRRSRAAARRPRSTSVRPVDEQRRAASVAAGERAAPATRVSPRRRAARGWWRARVTSGQRRRSASTSVGAGVERGARSCRARAASRRGASAGSRRPIAVASVAADAERRGGRASAHARRPSAPARDRRTVRRPELVGPAAATSSASRVLPIPPGPERHEPGPTEAGRGPQRRRPPLDRRAGCAGSGRLWSEGVQRPERWVAAGVVDPPLVQPLRGRAGRGDGAEPTSHRRRNRRRSPPTNSSRRQGPDRRPRRP